MHVHMPHVNLFSAFFFSPHDPTSTQRLRKGTAELISRLLLDEQRIVGCFLFLFFSCSVLSSFFHARRIDEPSDWTQGMGSSGMRVRAEVVDEKAAGGKQEQHQDDQLERWIEESRMRVERRGRKMRGDLFDQK